MEQFGWFRKSRTIAIVVFMSAVGFGSLAPHAFSSGEDIGQDVSNPMLVFPQLQGEPLKLEAMYIVGVPGRSTDWERVDGFTRNYILSLIKNMDQQSQSIVSYFLYYKYEGLRTLLMQGYESDLKEQVRNWAAEKGSQASEPNGRHLAALLVTFMAVDLRSSLDALILAEAAVGPPTLSNVWRDARAEAATGNWLGGLAKLDGNKREKRVREEREKLRRVAELDPREFVRNRLLTAGYCIGSICSQPMFPRLGSWSPLQNGFIPMLAAVKKGDIQVIDPHADQRIVAAIKSIPFGSGLGTESQYAFKLASLMEGAYRFGTYKERRERAYRTLLPRIEEGYDAQQILEQVRDVLMRMQAEINRLSRSNEAKALEFERMRDLLAELFHINLDLDVEFINELSRQSGKADESAAKMKRLIEHWRGNPNDVRPGGWNLRSLERLYFPEQSGQD